MNDSTEIKTTETKTSASDGNSEYKTKEVSTEKKTVVEEKPETTVVTTTVED